MLKFRWWCGHDLADKMLLGRGGVMKRAFFLFLVLPVLSHAEVFKCKADTGRVTYSASPCSVGAVPYDSDRVVIEISAARTVSVVRGSNGIFSLGGVINGNSVNFAIDTGASFTSLPGVLAHRLGFYKCSAASVTHTANGDAVSCSVVLSKISIAGFDFANVSVSILPGMTGETILLGSDLLRQFKIEQRAGVMTLSR